MLTSAVIEIEALQEGNLIGATGSAVHGFWLNHWRTIDPAYATALHDEHTIQPFTLSPLLGLPFPRRGEARVRPGQAAWLRVTTLTEELSQRFVQEWLTKLPGELQIGGLRWKPLRHTCTSSGHPWAGQTEPQTLADGCLLDGQPASRWRLHFETPTTFKIDKKINLPFPMPGMLVNSWLRRWQAFGCVDLGEQIKERLAEGLAVSYYRLLTAAAAKTDHMEIGCVGDITLVPVGLKPGECRIMDLLTALSFWTGSGWHTGQGMGLTRPIY